MTARIYQLPARRTPYARADAAAGDAPASAAAFHIDDERLARIFNDPAAAGLDLPDLYAWAEANEPRGSEAMWLMLGIAAALFWIGVLWIGGAL